jgi:hypothetical protein
MLGQAKTSLKTLEAIQTRRTARCCSPVEEEPVPEPPEEPKHVSFEAMDRIAEKLKIALRNRK